MKYIHDDPNKFTFFRRFLIDETLHYKGITDDEAVRAIRSGQDKWLLICTVKGDSEQRNRYYPVPRLLEEGRFSCPTWAVDAHQKLMEIMSQETAAKVAVGSEQPLPYQPTPKKLTTGLLGALKSLLKRFS